jgi:putative ABC transport system permease protein
VLLIACVNVANLLLARAAVREREIVVRRALGAGKLRILRQLLTESVLMALLGGAAGLALAIWGKDLLVAFISANLPTMDPIAIDHRVLGFNLGLALITGLAFGLAPALQASRIQLNESLMEGGRGATEGHTGRRLRNLLVVSEIALAMVLLIGAGLLLRSFLRLRGVDPGFRTDHTLCLTIDLTPAKYPKPQDQARFFKRVIEQLNILAGVQSVGASSSLDFYGSSGGTISGVQVEGRPEPFDTGWTTVSADYFRTMGIPLLNGRSFSESDREGMPGVIIVNETFARRFFPNADCLGKRVKVHDWRTIVGVVGDVRGYGVTRETTPTIYCSYLQDGQSHMRLLVRTSGDPIRWAAAVRSQIASVDKDQPPHGLMTLEQGLAEYFQPRRVTMFLLGVFAALALVLASIGIYGVLSYSVTQRTHEIGVRVALGALESDIMRSVLGQGIILTMAGILAGLAGTLGLTRFIRSLLYGVEETDVVTFGGISLLLLVVSTTACYLPARRATKVDPMVALRHE